MPGKPPILDPIFHQTVRTRLALLLFLGEISFSELKAALSTTDGNLDAHLRKLSGAGYLHSRMVLDGRPHTVYRLSESGMEAFSRYLDVLRAICAAAVPPRTGR
ncbi:MAG: transcriptional regulator [Pseudomonadota bacterium]